MSDRLFTNGTLILPDRLLDGFVHTSGNRIVDVGPGPGLRDQFSGEVDDFAGKLISQTWARTDIDDPIPGCMNEAVEQAVGKD